MSEDCLNLNVIRPAGEHKKLPVVVWNFGGGCYAASGFIADPQYNLSGIVKVSQEMGQSVIAVDMNYRLNMFGFLQTPQTLAEGSSNAGLLDQRLALPWVHENIAAFGGDPSRAVSWGEVQAPPCPSRRNLLPYPYSLSTKRSNEQVPCQSTCG
ncbi:alpha/beta-hydrolase [Coniochaeta sp. PMI_546]|nr:alpha/beta-hydrolase [Coniochaeta sp. PMI_546]